jgi:hypothetical protein
VALVAEIIASYRKPKVEDPKLAVTMTTNVDTEEAP